MWGWGQRRAAAVGALVARGAHNLRAREARRGPARALRLPRPARGAPGLMETLSDLLMIIK